MSKAYLVKYDRFNLYTLQATTRPWSRDEETGEIMQPHIQRLRLMPGLNRVPGDVWELFSPPVDAEGNEPEKHEALRRLMDDGHVTVVRVIQLSSNTNPEKVTSEDLRDMSISQAAGLIKQTLDRVVLEGWANDPRAQVREEVQAQLAVLDINKRASA